MRNNGDKDYYDLRSVLTHEVGHALGSQHPDAAWFNNNFELNFVPDNGGYLPQAPQGGEVMNEGNSPGFLPGSKPPKGLSGGEYWRIVSKDELLFMDHAYGQHIDFVEVDPNDNAELVIDLFNVGGEPGGTLGIGGPDSSESRNPGNPNAGRRILAAVAKVNYASNRPIGFQAAPRNWELTNNTGEAIDSLILRTRGTDNPNPTSWSSAGARRFQQRGTLAPPQIPSPDAFALGDVWHFFHDPVNGQINNGQSVEVGLRQDVWDWSLVAAQAIQLDNDFVPVNLVSILEWFVQGPVIPNANDDLPDDIVAEGLWELNATQDTLVKGFKIVNNDEETTTLIDELAFAPAPDLPAHPGLLNTEAKDRLGRDGVLETIPLASPLTLGPGQEYYFILEGLVDDLPRDIQQSGNFMVLTASPGLMDDQVFVYAASSGQSSTVGNFALLNTAVFVPEPSCLTLLTISIASLLAYGWRRRKRGR